jgi:hypothetical protein
MKKSSLAGLRQKHTLALVLAVVSVVVLFLSLCSGVISFFVFLGKPNLQGTMLCVALLFIIIGLAGAMLMSNDWLHYRQLLALAAEAKRLRLRFTDQPQPLDWEWLKSFDTFGGATSHQRPWYVMTGIFNDLEVSIMDYSCCVGAGRYANVFQQTVFVVHNALPGVPRFLLYTPGLMDRLIRKLFDKSVSIPGEEEFNKCFMLGAADAAAMRALFTPDVVDLCLEAPKHSMELRKGTLLVQAYKKRVAPATFAATLERIEALVQALRRNALLAN